MIKATVAICTYNRSAYLGACVDSVFEQEADFDYEVLVVDNNSTDNTAQIVADIQVKYPRLRYVVESQQGLSHARNRALRESEAEVVAFIDDDGVAQPGWLQNLIIPFSDLRVAVVGGAIRLDYPDIRPNWISDDMEVFLSKLDLGPVVKPVDEVFGCNYAARRSLAVEIGGFSTQLGFNGVSLLPGEETELCRRFRDHDRTVIYNGAAVVVHRVPPERLTKDWFRARHRGALEASYRSASQWNQDPVPGLLYAIANRLAGLFTASSDASFWLVLEIDRYRHAISLTDPTPCHFRSAMRGVLLLPQAVRWLVSALRSDIQRCR